MQYHSYVHYVNELSQFSQSYIQTLSDMLKRLGFLAHVSKTVLYFVFFYVLHISKNVTTVSQLGLATKACWELADVQRAFVISFKAK